MPFMTHINRRTVVGLLVISLLAGCAGGKKFESLEDLEPQATPEERAARMTELMDTSLDLSDEQVSRVREVNLTYANGVRWVARKRERDRQKSYYMRDIRAQRDADLRMILTREQYETYKARVEELTEQLIEDLGADDR